MPLEAWRNLRRRRVTSVDETRWRPTTRDPRQGPKSLPVATHGHIPHNTYHMFTCLLMPYQVRRRVRAKELPSGELTELFGA